MAGAPDSGRIVSSQPSGEEVPQSGERLFSAPPAPQAGSIFWRLGGVVQLIRPHQWVKNVFVLAPVFFAKDLFEPRLFLRAAGAFGVFCLLAGAVYAINDLADAEADRQHPVKRFRPVASGRVGPGAAKAVAVALVLVGLGAAAYGSFAFLATALAYFVLNLLYSFKLKHVAYVDVGLIATGFVLRVLAGGFGTHIEISKYLIACTALLALFLGFGKRRHELAAAAHGSHKTRAALEAYSASGLDRALKITGLLTVGTYVAYTLDSHTRSFFGSDHLWLTTVFVVLAVLRFLHLVRNRPKAESPTQEMLRDGPFVAAVLLWIMVVVWIVYNLRPS